MIKMFSLNDINFICFSRGGICSTFYVIRLHACAMDDILWGVEFVTHSLTHSAVSSIHPNMGKHAIYGHKKMHASSKKFILAFANRSCEEVFYVLSLRYKILSLKIGSLPSILHTKRIHSDGKSVYRKTDRLIEGPFRNCDTN